MDFQSQTIDGAILTSALFSQNGTDEIHQIVQPATGGTFTEQLANIISAQATFQRENQIPSESLVFTRYFISDYANQADVLEQIEKLSSLESLHPVVSVVQQPPLSANKVQAWSYFIHDHKTSNQTPTIRSSNSMLLNRGPYQHQWNTSLVSNNGVVDSADQTVKVFNDYKSLLAPQGLTLKENCIRTWLFVKDIDYNYHGVVKARKELFEGLGMTEDTHYITSTGIEGRHSHPKNNVLMDAYAVGGLASSQIRFLQAREYLNPTHEYGVTFERGTSVDYGDRRHILISGTASINNKGDILHCNDTRKQSARAMENIAQLLKDAEATMQDVAHLIIYLRDMSDAATVQDFFTTQFPSIPKVLVLAPVCRPGWLVEVECMAIKILEKPEYPRF